MSLRARTGNVDDYGRTHEFEIYDSEWGGSVTDLKNTGSGYASFSHQVIDPREPELIQMGALEISLWVDDDTLVDDIKGADEEQFHIIHKIDTDQEWIGYVYNDLSSFEEGFDGHSYRITLMAKDFTALKAKDYLVSSSLPDDREKAIETIAYLLNEQGFSIDIKTHTSWIEENLEAAIAGDYDYLNQIYNETRALRTFASNGDEEDQPIKVFDALQKMCAAHRLIIKQTGGVYWIDQLTEYEDPENVQEAVYNLSGVQSSLTTGNDLTVDANTSDLKVVISQDNRDNEGLPGIKIAQVTFDHRSQASFLSLPNNVYISGQNTESYSQPFGVSTNQQISMSGKVRVDDSLDESSGYARIKLRVGQYFWDGNKWTTDTSDRVRVDLTGGGIQNTDGDFIYIGSFDFTTDDIPTDANSPMEVELLYGIIEASPEQTADQTSWLQLSFGISNVQDSDANTSSIDYQLTQSDNFSKIATLEDTIYGDGPSQSSPSALRYSSSLGDITSGSWQRRGSTSYRPHAENLLKETMDTQRGWRRLLTALLKGKYYPHQVLSYDGDYLYYLGGDWDIFTGNWAVNLFKLDVVTGSDTFTDIPKFRSTVGGGGGADQSTTDNKYFKQSELLGEIATGDQNTAIGNLGITATKAELNRLDGTLSEVQGNLGLKNSTAALDISSLSVDNALSADTLRPDTGKFLSPVSYQFRNAGDTGFRNVQMADLTAVTGTFSAGNSGGTFRDEPLRVEKDGSWFAHFLRPDADQVGFLFGNATDAITGGIVQKSSGEIDFRTGGNQTIATLWPDGLAIEGGKTLSTSVSLSGSESLRVIGDVLIEGVADIETAQIQTLRTTLFKPTTISGMGGKIAFSAVSTVVSIDTGNNDIVVEDAVFANGDSVVVSSAIYNQSGFSNVELNITSAGSSVSGGTEYTYTVNSGDESDIASGDSVTRVNGDLVYINATEGSESPRIAGYDNLTGFSDSPLSGDTATAVWELNPTGGIVGGAFFDENAMWAIESVKADSEFVLDWENGILDLTDSSDVGLRLISGAIPEIEMVASSGDVLHIGGEFSFDGEDDVNIARGDFTPSVPDPDPEISESGTSSDNLSEDHDFDVSSYTGRFLRLSISYFIEAITATTGDDATAAATITFTYLDSGGSQVQSPYTKQEQISFSDGNGGQSSDTIQVSESIPATTETIRVSYNLSVTSEGSSGATSATARAEFSDPVGLIIGEQEFLSPLGLQMTNQGSAQTAPPRIRLERDNGRALSHQVVVEGENGDTFTFAVTSGGQLKLYDGTGTGGSELDSWG